MSVDVQLIKQFKSDLRDLADQELAVWAKRKQLFDKLAAEYGDDREARRAGRAAYYAVQREALLRRIEENLEFLFMESEEEMSDEDVDGTEPA